MGRNQKACPELQLKKTTLRHVMLFADFRSPALSEAIRSRMPPEQAGVGLVARPCSELRVGFAIQGRIRVADTASFHIFILWLRSVSEGFNDACPDWELQG